MSFAFWLTSCFVVISRLICGALKSSVSFFWMAHIPSCTWTTSSLSIHLLMDILVASLSWLLWIWLQCSFCSLCLFDSGLLRWEAEWCTCWIERYLNFYFSMQLLSVLIIGCYQFTCHQQVEGTQLSKTPSAFIVCRRFADGQSTRETWNIFVD